MKPTDSEPPEHTSDTPEAPQPPKNPRTPKTPRGERKMTQRAFDKLLEQLSPDRDEAGKGFVAIESLLGRYFERRRVNSADTLVDEVIDRVARRIDEGVIIKNLRSYIHTVANIVYLETLKGPVIDDVDLDTFRAPEPDPPSEETERRQTCLEACLAKWPPETRDLILTYYREKGHAGIVLRRQMAARLNIRINALRIRAHRLRAALEKCIEECIAAAVRRNVTG